MTKTTTYIHNTTLTTFTVLFLGYTNISNQLMNAIISLLNKTNSLLLPSQMTIKIVNASGSCNPTQDGTPVYGKYYLHGVKHICEANTIYIYTKGITIEKIQETLAHELGHAEHFQLHQDSTNWESSRQEAYAYTISKLLVEGSAVEVKDSRYTDISLEAGYVIRK